MSDPASDVPLVDARGLACPHPVLLLRRALQQTRSRRVAVLVDAEDQAYNCTRAAEKLGWHAVSVPTADGLRVELQREAGAEPERQTGTGAEVPG